WDTIDKNLQDANIKLPGPTPGVPGKIQDAIRNAILASGCDKVGPGCFQLRKLDHNPYVDSYAGTDADGVAHRPLSPVPSHCPHVVTTPACPYPLGAPSAPLGPPSAGDHVILNQFDSQPYPFYGRVHVEWGQ